MAFNTHTGRIQYTVTDTSIKDYTFDFKIFQEDDIELYIGATKLILDQGYTVVIDGDIGGTVTISNTLLLNELITIIRELGNERIVEFQKQSPIYADDLNLDQDFQSYQIADLTTRTENDFYRNSAPNISTYMPIPKAGQLLGWNSGEDALENKDPGAGGATTGGQYLGSATVKAVSYLNPKTDENLILGTVGEPLNGFAVNNFEIEVGGSLDVSPGSTFNVL